MKVKATRARPKIEVTADRRGIVSHAGLRLAAEVADSLGLTAAPPRGLLAWWFSVIDSDGFR